MACVARAGCCSMAKAAPALDLQVGIGVTPQRTGHINGHSEPSLNTINRPSDPFLEMFPCIVGGRRCEEEQAQEDEQVPVSIWRPGGAAYAQGNYHTNHTHHYSNLLANAWLCHLVCTVHLLTITVAPLHLTAFLRLQEDKHSGDVLVTAIKRDHPLLADFRPLPNYATAGGAAAGATAGPNGSDTGGAGAGTSAAAGASGAAAGGGELVIQEMWRAGKELHGVLDTLGIRSDAMFTEKEVGAKVGCMDRCFEPRFAN